MSDKRIPLVAFSGGLDSTLVLLDALKEGPVDTVYIKGRVGKDKIRAELETRDIIFDYIRMNKENYHQVRFDTIVEAGDIGAGRRLMNTATNVDEAETIDLLNGRVFYQPATWMYHAALVAVQGNNSTFLVGYIRGDQAPVIRTELTKLWELNQFCLRPPVVPIPIEFPLIWIDKLDVITRLVNWHQENLPMSAWSCEAPVPDEETEDDLRQCGKCDPCRKHNMYYREFLERRRVEKHLRPTSDCEQKD